jgi:hypothetical protein
MNPAVERLLSRGQGFVEYREHSGVASRIVHDGEAPAEPAGSTEAFRQLVADAHRFFWVADKIVGGAVNRAQGAPLGSRLIVARDPAAARGARKRTRCPVRPVSDECAERLKRRANLPWRRNVL